MCEMRAGAEAVVRRTLACHGYPPVVGRNPGSHERKRKPTVEFPRMPVRSVQPVTVADGWKGSRAGSIGSEAATACRRPMSRPGGTRHPNGMARARGRRSAEVGGGFGKIFCVFFGRPILKNLCVGFRSPPGGPQKLGPTPLGARPVARGLRATPPPLRFPLPRFAAPSPVRGRGAERAARSVRRGAPRRQPTPATRPPPWCAGGGRTRVARCRTARARCAVRGRGRRARNPSPVPPPRISRRAPRAARNRAVRPQRGAARGRRAAARSAKPGGPRVVRAARKPTPATRPPPWCAGGGRTRVARCRTALARGAGGERARCA
jgi:hypothetical protein